METARMRVGKMGEDLACEYLERLGHTIVERNWRSGHYELDIISLDKEGIHFVEVKSRVAPVAAAPEENVGYAKQRKLVRAAQLYLHSGRKKEKLDVADSYFDIISVIFEGEKTDITYFPKAYVPLYY